MVQQPRLLQRVHQGARHPGAAVRGVRPAARRRGRGQHRDRVQGPAGFPAGVAGTGQPGPLPRGRRAASALGADRHRLGARPVRGQLRCRPVAPVPAVAAPRAVRHQGPLLQQGRGLLRLRAALAALPRELRDGGHRAQPDRGRGRALPFRRDPAAGSR